MHPIRAISAITVFATAVFYSSQAMGTMSLNDVMSPNEQKTTGVAQLTPVQKQALEGWINAKFVLKTVSTPSQPLYLQQNIQGGTQLMFSDGSVYEIAPTDRAKATFWITPISVSVQPSGDPDYPAKITNTLTGVSVNGKLVKAPNPAVAPQQ